MPNKKINVKQIIGFSGAFIAFMFGSGFATGQEVMQYFVSYGYKGLLGAMVCFILLLYVSINYAFVGKKEHYNKGSKIFIYYCGKYIGKFFDYFSVFVIYLSFTVMLAGAGATVNQHYGIPTYIGTILIGLLAGITVMLGLSKIINIIGKIGPVIIILTTLLGLFSMFNHHSNLPLVNEVLPNIEIMQASTNWLFSAFSYVGISILWLASFMTALGASADSMTEAKLGAGFGVGAFCCALVILMMGILANIENVAGSMIPTLILARDIHESVAMLFSIIIITGIYTTAVPLLWTVSSRVVDEKTKKFKIFTIILAITGIVVGATIPFDKLVNIIYVTTGYVGFILLFFMLITSIRRFVIKQDIVR